MASQVQHFLALPSWALDTQSQPTHPWLGTFLSHAAVLNMPLLEVSFKWRQGQRTGQRPSMGTFTQVPQQWAACLQRLEQFGHGVSRRFIDDWLGALSVSGASMLIYGVELDAAVAQSSVKLYLKLERVVLQANGHWASWQDRLLEAFPLLSPDILSFGNPMLGFDTWGNGRTDLRLYLDIEAMEAIPQSWRDCVGDEQLLSQFQGPGVWGFAHKPADDDLFVYLLRPQGIADDLLALGASHSRIEAWTLDGQAPYVLGASLRDWRARRFDDVNTYHMIAHHAGRLKGRSGYRQQTTTFSPMVIQQ